MDVSELDVDFGNFVPKDEAENDSDSDPPVSDFSDSAFQADIDQIIKHSDMDQSLKEEDVNNIG